MPNFNFSAGPAVLPKSVLEKAKDELLDYNGSEMSVMELSHRSKLFEKIIKKAEERLRKLMAIPDNYTVLFLQGGASLQFTMLPMNLAQGKMVQFIDTGSWSQKAMAAAKQIGNVEVDVLASSKEGAYTYLPEIDSSLVDPEAAYVHITTNNTIEGTAFHTLPDTGEVPLVADMSSNILANEYNVEDFGVIYAGAQKNIGPAGVTVVIIREDLIGLNETAGPLLDYQTVAEKGSLYNTPPTFAIYMANLVFEWIEEQGGSSKMLKQAQEKAHLLYHMIDESECFHNPVEESSRSLTNIPFVTGEEARDKQFIAEAEKAGFYNLKGHRTVGGMRASLYNAFPIEGVHALIDFMKAFERKQ